MLLFSPNFAGISFFYCTLTFFDSFKAKNLGNYHSSIKGLFEASSTGQSESRKRERGLKMGVGRFSGGMLKLSREEIATAQGSSSSGRGRDTRGRGRGRGGGGGGGRGQARGRGRRG